VVLPPEHDPIPASGRFALLKTATLETPAAWRGGGGVGKFKRGPIAGIAEEESGDNRDRRGFLVEDCVIRLEWLAAILSLPLRFATLPHDVMRTFCNDVDAVLFAPSAV
jgi:hypothetical protein